MWMPNLKYSFFNKAQQISNYPPRICFFFFSLLLKDQHPFRTGKAQQGFLSKLWQEMVKNSGNSELVRPWLLPWLAHRAHSKKSEKKKALFCPKWPKKRHNKWHKAATARQPRHAAKLHFALKNHEFKQLQKSVQPQWVWGKKSQNQTNRFGALWVESNAFAWWKEGLVILE